MNNQRIVTLIAISILPYLNVFTRKASNKMNLLEKKFTQDMLDICDKSVREINYNPMRFRGMINNIGALAAAKKLIRKDGGTDGFARLWEADRLDLTVEAHVIRDEYKILFTTEERQICLDRLYELGYSVQC